MKKIALSIAFLLFTIANTFAQSSEIEMATVLRSSGKIWVVVTVLLTIMVGLFVYLFLLDKRVKKLENK